MTILSEQGAGDSVHEVATFGNQPGALIEPVRAAAGASRFVPFSPDTSQRLHALADAQGVGVGQLMRQWILDRLEAEEHGRRQEQIAVELEQLARRLRASV